MPRRTKQPTQFLRSGQQPLQAQTPQDKALDAFRDYLTEHPDAAQRILEQVNSTYLASSPTQEDWYWGRLATGGEEDYFWRRLSDNWYQKDVIPSTFLEIHNQCYEAYNANPLAYAIIEMTTSFVLGKGVKVTAEKKGVQNVIDAFWNDPDNHMDTRIYDACRELSLYGEIYVRFFVNKYDGTTKIRFIDPSIIDQVETDPDDVEHHLRYHRRPIGPSPTQTMDPVANTLDRVALNQASVGISIGDPTMQGQWFEAGKEVVQFAINKVSNAKRGKSDLATLLPWLRRYKDWLTDRVRINKYKGAFLWDVTLKGADAKIVNRKKMDYAYPPEPGTVIIHNEAEVWAAVKPEINANDAANDGRAIKLMIAVGALLPEHYLSDGDNSNRATSAEMSLPTFLKFQMRQHVMKNIIKTCCDRAIFEAQAAGKLAQRANVSYSIIMPEIDTGDNQSMAQAVSFLMTAIAQAIQLGLMSKETAMVLIFKCLNEEVDVHDELARIQADIEQAKQQMMQMQQMQQTNGSQQPNQPQPAPWPQQQKLGSLADSSSDQSDLGKRNVPKQKVAESVDTQQNTGMMLAFYPSPAVADALSKLGDQASSDIHLTLAYLGDTQDAVTNGLRPNTSPFKIRDALQMFASSHAPMDGIIQGLGRFTSVPDGDLTPVYASVDAPGLAKFRSDLVELVQGTGYFVAQDHDFTAHCTLQYIDADAPMPDITLPSNPSLPFRLDTLWLIVGNKRYSFSLGGTS